MLGSVKYSPICRSFSYRTGVMRVDKFRMGIFQDMAYFREMFEQYTCHQLSFNVVLN